MKVTGFSVGGVEENIETICNDPSIIKAIPNPFSNRTTIYYNLPRSANISLRILDTSGRIINELINGIMSEGSHTATWTGNNISGEKVKPGVYFYHLFTDEINQSGRIIMMQ